MFAILFVDLFARLFRADCFRCPCSLYYPVFATNSMPKGSGVAESDQVVGIEDFFCHLAELFRRYLRYEVERFLPSGRIIAVEHGFRHTKRVVLIVLRTDCHLSTKLLECCAELCRRERCEHEAREFVTDHIHAGVELLGFAGEVG